MPKPKQDRKRHEVGSTDLRQRISYFLTRAAFHDEPVIVSRQGVPDPIAVMVSYEEYRRLTAA